MESFEMPNSGFDQIAPRQAESQSQSQSVQPEHISEATPKPEPKPAPKVQDTTSAASTTKPKKVVPNPTSVDNTSTRTTDSTATRITTFLGIVLLVIATYCLIAAIGFLSNGAADQSVVENRTLAEIAQSPSVVQNSTGKLGAYFSNFVISRWIGLSAFILIFYLGTLGIALIKFTHVHIKFWRFTFKSFVAAIALSILLGAITYTSESPIHWGGLHGYIVTRFFYDYSGFWGCMGICVIMASALVLIFIKPISTTCRIIRNLLSSITNKIHERYKASMQAGRTIQSESITPEPEINTVPQTEHELPLEETKAQTTDYASDRANLDSDPLTDIAALATARTATASENETDTNSTVEAIDFDVTPYPIEPVLTQLSPIQEPEQSKETPASETLIIEQPKIVQAETIDIDIYDPTADLSRYHLPSISLLREYPDKGAVIDEKEQEENKQVIINTLRTYGVEISSIKATVGPTITLYEIVPAEGVRIATIKRLSDDMTLSLSAIGIRIIAPIPGKGTIGMEVPNKKKQIVSIRDVLSSKAFQESSDELPLAMGTTISNEVFITDLAKMPHLLVAGATGMGKSVGLNTIIASLLYKKHPAELKMVLIDPKMVEFSLYKCIEKHFLAKLPEEENAIITDPNKVVATLNSLCIEMDNRYKLLSEAGLRGIKDYNKKFISRHLNPNKGHRYLPYIVVIIDEFADLIITAGKEVEAPISRIAAKARAVGIHMILATQRPSVNVITGVIKANFPGRMAFRVTQMNDSRTIIDRPGAEQLVGKGDMLISRDGVIDRVQCAFIDTDEVERMTQAIADQMGYPTAYELPESLPAETASGVSGISSGDRDALYPEAGRAVIESQQASTSFLQRKFNIGYPRAGKIMDQLESAGVIGPASGMKPRTILMDMYAFELSLNP